MILTRTYTKFRGKDSKNCSHIAQHDGGAVIRAEELENQWPGLVEPWLGTGSVTAQRASSPENAGPDALVFAGQPEQLATALAKGAGLIVASGKLTPPAALPAGTRLFRSGNVGLAMAAILPRFDRKKDRFRQTPARHPSAVIHPAAEIADDVIVGPGAVIGYGVTIGAGALIGANTTVEAHAKIGARTILHPQVHFGAGCEIGEDGEIHPHTTIGSDGFGYARDKDGRLQKLPQLGVVILGDRVEIGAGCAIDRAAFDVTRIRSGTKLDNLVHIAHNCDIGEDGAIAAGFMIAGSSKLGKRFMTGGNSVVTDHVTVHDDVTLAGRSSVTNDVTAPGVYGGHPLVPVKEHLKILASSVHVPKLRKQMAKVLKHLGLQEDSE